MSLKNDITDTFFALNDFNLEYEEMGKVNEEKLHRLIKLVDVLKKNYSQEEVDLNILAVLGKRQKDRNLKSDMLNNEVYWHLNKKKVFSAAELASLVSISTQAMTERIKRGVPVVSKQTAIGKRIVEGQEVKPEEVIDDSFNILVSLRDSSKMPIRDKIELEKQINNRTNDLLTKQTVEKKQELERLLNWVVDVMVPEVNKANRETLRNAGVKDVNVDVRPLIKKAIENGIFNQPTS